MGMFDRICADFKCPKCGWHDTCCEYQTKDLSRNLIEYVPMWDEEDLKKNSRGYNFLKGLGRLDDALKQSAIRRRNLKFVTANVTCEHCYFHKQDPVFYDAKFKVVKGHLVGEAYDLVPWYSHPEDRIYFCPFCSRTEEKFMVCCGFDMMNVPKTSLDKRKREEKT
jgi:hypothetical protein